MRALKEGFGMAIASLGVAIALFPFFSVWRASSQALDQLPPIVGPEFSDKTNRVSALFDDEMILARRSYSDITTEEFKQHLAEAGFQSHRTPEHHWYTKDCCGEWDAVWVRTQPSGDVVAVLTMYDTDIQATWVFVSIVGLFVFLGGTVLTRHRTADRTVRAPNVDATT